METPQKKTDIECPLEDCTGMLTIGTVHPPSTGESTPRHRIRIDGEWTFEAQRAPGASPTQRTATLLYPESLDGLKEGEAYRCSGCPDLFVAMTEPPSD